MLTNEDKKLILRDINTAVESVRNEMRNMGRYSDTAIEDADENINESESAIVDQEINYARLEARVARLEEIVNSKLSD